MKNYFWETLSNFGDQPALIQTDSNRKISYSDLNRITDEIAEQFISDRKKLFFLFTNNSIESLISYLSILKSGDSVLLLDEKLNYEMRVKLIEIYKPAIIINQQKEVEGYRKHSVYMLGDLLYRIDEPDVKLHPSLKVLLSTSGTTGSPKLVRLSADNIQSNADSISQYLEIDDKERPITTLPYNYSYGLSVINSHLSKGASIVLTEKTVFFKDFWDDFKKFECTSFAGVPYTYQILKRTGFDKLDLPSLKTMTQAGGKLNEELIKYFADYAEKKNVRFFVMYGQTEATARISYVPYKMLKNKIGSIGISIPGGKLKLMNESTEITEPNNVGEIVYEGENVMLGYAESLEDLSKGNELNFLLHTGDLGYFDEDGFFYVTGRMKRFIKIYGLRVNLDEVQKMIENNFHIPAACTGEDEKLKVLIQTQDEAETIVKQKICETYKLIPSAVVVKQCESIPTNTSGKYDYNKINTMF